MTVAKSFSYASWFIDLTRFIAGQFVLCSLILPLPAMSQELTSKRPNLVAKPVALDWRKISWSSLDYDRVAIPGGGALYTYVANGTRKFSMDLVFRSGVYAFDVSTRPALGAYADLLLEGGTTKQSYEQIQKFTSENGIRLASNLTALGDLHVKVEGLLIDFDKALDLVSEVLFTPGFREAAFETWKRSQTSEFEGLLDASSLREQYRLLEPWLIGLTFGPGHYFGTFLERTKPSVINKISLDEVKKIHEKMVTKSSLVAMLAGGIKKEQIDRFKTFLNRLPHAEPRVPTWLPDRAVPIDTAKAKSAKNVDIVIINKKDMTQSSIAGRILLKDIGKLNALEEVELAIAREVFSSTSGVVGEDRFSGALRKRSGLSYSAFAQVDPEGLKPNTNDGTWNLMFQTPADKTADGIKLAWEVWQEFARKGITESEFNDTRTILMNKMLSQEIPVIEKAQGILGKLIQYETPPTLPETEWLIRLEKINSHASINRLIERLTAQENTRMSFALMGGVSNDELALIKKLPFVSRVETIDFDEMISKLK